MDTWGYLILIAALGIVAALMLYARFASRSREKSVHHAPSELEPRGDLRREEPSEIAPPAAGIKKEDEPRIVAEPIASEANEEEEYLDELQEAAAGLAMLMRSSPVSNRTNPVVFAPEGEEALEDGTEALVEEVAEKVETDPVVSDSAPVKETEEVEIVHSETLSETEGPAFSVIDFLGSEVSDQIDRIDNGLDDLENLVVNIEECLASLDSLGGLEGDLAEETESVEVAA